MRSPLLLVITLLLVGISVPLKAANWSESCLGVDKSFPAFLQQFTEDRNFQILRIYYPLVIRDGLGFDHGLSVKSLNEKSIKNLKYPLIPSLAAQKEAHLEGTITVSTEAYVELLIVQSDTDRYVQTFQFRKIGDCWFLEGILQQSQ